MHRETDSSIHAATFDSRYEVSRYPNMLISLGKDELIRFYAVRPTFSKRVMMRKSFFVPKSRNLLKALS